MQAAESMYVLLFNIAVMVLVNLTVSKWVKLKKKKKKQQNIANILEAYCLSCQYCMAKDNVRLFS